MAIDQRESSSTRLRSNPSTRHSRPSIQRPEARATSPKTGSSSYSGRALLAWITNCFTDLLVDYGLYFDFVLRFLIRRLLDLRSRSFPSNSNLWRYKIDFIDRLNACPTIAVNTSATTKQHYHEPPSELFVLMLGKHLKYSSGYWDQDVRTLDESEERMMDLYIERAGLRNGMKVLDLGCGWGSLSGYIATKFPACEVTALSNSPSQRRFIESYHLPNLTVITADVNTWVPSPFTKYNRIFSIEMFEHMRNYQKLFKDICSPALNTGGKMFVHIFCHRSVPYTMEPDEKNSWLARWFFTGGTFPSFDTFAWINKGDLQIERCWPVSGIHYAKTCRAFFNNLQRHKSHIIQLFDQTYGAGEGWRWFNRWRVFLMAYEETFRFRDSSEWMLGHYLFSKPERTR